MEVYLGFFFFKKTVTTARKSKEKPEKSVPEDVKLISIRGLRKGSLVTHRQADKVSRGGK